MGAIYEVYIDVLAVNNFFVDLAALWAVHIFRRKGVHAHRILAGAALGTLGSCLAFLVCQNPVAYLLIVHFLLNPLVLFACFREKSKHDFFSDLSIGYFTFLVIGGTVEWLYAGGRGMVPYGAAVCLALLILAMSALWLGRRFRDRVRYLEAAICQEGKLISLRALSDSGNLLADPYTGKPVSLVDRHAYEAAYGSPQAVRLIPYESLGCQHGLLEVVTVEELSYAYGTDGRRIRKAVLGLVDHALFEKKPYQMIINPTGGDYERDR